MRDYEELRRLCEFGTKPDGDKVVVCEVGGGWASRRYRVVSNPIGLDAGSIALFCDGGNLPFGWHANGGVVCVHTD